MNVFQVQTRDRELRGSPSPPPAVPPAQLPGAGHLVGSKLSVQTIPACHRLPSSRPCRAVPLGQVLFIRAESVLQQCLETGLIVVPGFGCGCARGI